MRRTRAIASLLAHNNKTKPPGAEKMTMGQKQKQNANTRQFFTSATDMTVTHSSTDKNVSIKNNTNKIHSNNESMELVDKLLFRTSEMLNPHAANVVAYSGGVDSSLVAALVHRVFSDYDDILLSSTNNNNRRGTVQAVLGISSAVPQSQIDTARKVADSIGISLMEVSTAEGNDEAYIRNDGHACFVCKTHLYSTLNAVANAFMQQYSDNGRDDEQRQKVLLYNGTNADDRQDPTRLGLLAASNFSVHSPLDQINKEQVRQAAKYLGLSNWNAAASPCLRSRLAMGVMATEEHLRAVEMAEAFVRNVLELDETINARVRMLSGGKAMVELDNSIIKARDHLDLATELSEHGFGDKCVNEWGFRAFGGVREFKSGSVAEKPDDNSPLAAATL